MTTQLTGSGNVDTDAPWPRYDASIDDDATYVRFADIITNTSLGVLNPDGRTVDLAARIDYRREGCAIAELIAAEKIGGPIHVLADLLIDTVHHLLHDVYVNIVRMHREGRLPSVVEVPSGERPPPWPGYEAARDHTDDLVWCLADIVAAVGSGNRQPDNTIEFDSREPYERNGQRAIDAIVSLKSLDSLNILAESPEMVALRLTSFLIWTADCVAYDTATTTIRVLASADSGSL